MFILTVKKTIIDTQTTSWRFEVKTTNFEILNDKKFSNYLINEKEIYVIFCVNVTLAKDKETFLFEFSTQLNEYQKLFNKEKTNNLSEQDKKDHVIKLIKKIILYIFLQFISDKVSEASTILKKYFNKKLN